MRHGLGEDVSRVLLVRQEPKGDGASLHALHEGDVPTDSVPRSQRALAAADESVGTSVRISVGFCGGTPRPRSIARASSVISPALPVPIASAWAEQSTTAPSLWVVVYTCAPVRVIVSP